MAKRKTIQKDPLDSYVPPEQAEPGESVTPSKETSKPGSATKIEKERLTVHIPVNLIDRVKNAVYWTPGLTLARLAEKALGKEMEELEKEKGGPFPPRQEELRGGRPLK